MHCCLQDCYVTSSCVCVYTKQVCSTICITVDCTIICNIISSTQRNITMKFCLCYNIICNLIYSNRIICKVISGNNVNTNLCRIYSTICKVACCDTLVCNTLRIDSDNGIFIPLLFYLLRFRACDLRFIHVTFICQRNCTVSISHISKCLTICCP